MFLHPGLPFYAASALLLGKMFAELNPYGPHSMVWRRCSECHQRLQHAKGCSRG